MTVRLEWDGKSQGVDRLSLPFQTVETINESRATRKRDAGGLFESGGQPPEDARNRLIWGDNKLIMSSLLKDFAGCFKLIYIDPPFDTGTDFSFRLQIGEQAMTKTPSVLEEHAYRDTWGGGRASYLSMIGDRLHLIRELLADDGSFSLHCAPNVSHYLKVLCDEVFGAEAFRSEIAWKRSSAHSDSGQGRRQYGAIHDVILFYAPGQTWTWNTQHLPYDESYVQSKYRNVEVDSGRLYRLDNLTAPGGEARSRRYKWCNSIPCV